MSGRKVLFLLSLFLALPALAQDLTIGAASDLQFALKEVASGFEKTTGTKVSLNFGSSGTLFAQIQNGAPFDLFFSADIEYPEKLEAAALVVPGSITKYAEGRIVLWVPNSSPLDLKKLGMNALVDPRVRRVAIANPAHAPYGRAAKAALEHYQLCEKVKDKIVMGENISQTAQFVQTGNADIGILALSLAMSPALKNSGRYWEIPQDAYPRLQQAAVILKASRNQSVARQFLEFVKSDQGHSILKQAGFTLPETEREKRK